MKPIFTLFLVLSAFLSTAQVTVNFGGGFNNTEKLVSNIEVGYQFKKMQLSAGYLVSITDLAEVPDLFFLKAGRQIQLTPKSHLELGTGLALHTFKYEEVSNVDHNYTYFRTINAGKPLFYINYQKRVISDGAFFIQALYSGNIIYGGVGLTYFFKQKKKAENNAEKEK